MSDTNTNQVGDGAPPANLAVLGGARPGEPATTSPGADTLNKQAPEPFPDRVKRIAESIAIMRVTTVIGTLTGVVGQDDLKQVTFIDKSDFNDVLKAEGTGAVRDAIALALNPQSATGFRAVASR